MKSEKYQWHLFLLGAAQLTYQGKPVGFPFQKAEALFFYLAVNKTARRDELVNLFWSELPESVGRKNLRNALYHIRKILGQDVVLSLSRQEIGISKTFLDLCLSDVDFLFSKNDLFAYKGIFLKGYYIDGAEPFQEWVQSYRIICHNQFIDGAYGIIEQSPIYKILESKAMEDENHEEGEHARIFIKALKHLIAHEPYDEKAHRLLMSAYGYKGETHRALSVYEDLKTRLNEELGVDPDFETKMRFNELVALKTQAAAIEKPITLYGRRPELDTIQQALDRFKMGIPGAFLLVEGEAGIGKTALKEAVLINMVKPHKDIVCIESACYQTEKNFYLKAWHHIIEQIIVAMPLWVETWPLIWKREITRTFPSLCVYFSMESFEGDLSLSMALYRLEDVLESLFSALAKRGPFLLVIDDLQWMDEGSLSILSNLLRIWRQKNIFFLGLIRASANLEVRRFKDMVLQNGIARSLHLARLSEGDVKKLIDENYPELCKKNTLDKIYSETKGNPFFVDAYLRAIEKGQSNPFYIQNRDIIKERFDDLSPQAKNCVDLAACFSDKIALEALKQVSGQEELQLVSALEELETHNILIETGILGQYTFSHHKLREYVYTNMSETRRILIHRKIGDWFVSQTEGQNAGYEQGSYHYQQAGDSLKSIAYELMDKQKRLNMEHELYPVIEGGFDHILQDKKDVPKLQKWFSDLQASFDTLEIRPHDRKKADEVLMHLLLMKGRHDIREGRYKRGIYDIERLILMAKSSGEKLFYLKGLRQKIVCAVQNQDLDGMEKSVDEAVDILKSYEAPEEEGMIRRLYGLALIMKKDFDNAEKEIKRAMSLFKKIDDHRGRYRLNIAACHNYLGNIYQKIQKREQAIKSYEMAVEISSLAGPTAPTAIFMTNLGTVYLEKGDFTTAKECFLEALREYDLYGTVWKRAVAEGYLALIFHKEKNAAQSKKHLNAARTYAKKLKNPLSLAVYEQVCREIFENKNTALSGGE